MFGFFKQRKENKENFEMSRQHMESFEKFFKYALISDDHLSARMAIAHASNSMSYAVKSNNNELVQKLIPFFAAKAIVLAGKYQGKRVEWEDIPALFDKLEVLKK